jgi:hypothetical protein
MARKTVRVMSEGEATIFLRGLGLIPPIKVVRRRADGVTEIQTVQGSVRRAAGEPASGVFLAGLTYPSGAKPLEDPARGPLEGAASADQGSQVSDPTEAPCNCEGCVLEIGPDLLEEETGAHLAQLESADPARGSLEDFPPPVPEPAGNPTDLADSKATDPLEGAADPLEAQVTADHTGCDHAWKDFPLPAEPKGRVFQCAKCLVIGYRRTRGRAGLPHGGGKVEIFYCTKPKCPGVARGRLPGRLSRGAYIWACAAHMVTAAPAGQGGT